MIGAGTSARCDVVATMGSMRITTAAALTAAVTLLGACTVEGGDPDPQFISTVTICSDVPVHVWATVNVGTDVKPDNKSVDYDVDASGHDRDPFADTAAKGCPSAAGAFGSDVKLVAADLNDGEEYVVSAPDDRRHVLVVRLTKTTDGKVTAAKQLLAAPE
jgi:hypothetical protein